MVKAVFTDNGRESSKGNIFRPKTFDNHVKIFFLLYVSHLFWGKKNIT